MWHYIVFLWIQWNNVWIEEKQRVDGIDKKSSRYSNQTYKSGGGNKGKIRKLLRYCDKCEKEFRSTKIIRNAELARGIYEK